jgi:hypothetical protein
VGARILFVHHRRCEMSKPKKRPKPEVRTDYAVRVKGTRKWCGWIGIEPFAHCMALTSRRGIKWRMSEAIRNNPSLRGKLEIVPLRVRPLSVRARASARRTR